MCVANKIGLKEVFIASREVLDCSTAIEMAVSESSLHYAAESGDVDKIRELLQQGKYAVNCTDSTGKTPLHYACTKGCMSVVRVLVSEFKVDQSIQDVDGHTALMLAAMAGHSDVVNILLHECPALDARDNHGWGVLHHACSGGDINIVHTLYKADIYQCSRC